MSSTSNEDQYSNATRVPRLLSLTALALTGACSVGPAYKPPMVEPPSTFKEATAAAGRTWSPAQPRDAADRGEWWRPSGDPELDALEDRVDVSSQTIRRRTPNSGGAGAR